MSTETIGERLEAARKRLGVSLREASDATKIRPDYLQNMESGNFDFPLPEVYKRGFLKNYARHLKLDPEKFAADFNAQHLAGGRFPRRDGREPLGQVDLATRATSGTEPADPRANAQIGGLDTGVGGDLDGPTLLKIAIWFAAAVLVLVLVFVIALHFMGASSTAAPPAPIASDNSAAGPAPTPPTTAQTTTAGPMYHLVFSANAEDISLLKVLKGATPLYSGALTRGSPVTIAVDSPVQVMVSAAQDLIIEQDGQRYALNGKDGKTLTGTKSFFWPAQGTLPPSPTKPSTSSTTPAAGRGAASGGA